ncbi:MAG: UDP-N-acetylmuramoyl-tripeptide--D-alanyl-D-alanine ligase, partial [Minisyncoccia bacterium]
MKSFLKNLISVIIQSEAKLILKKYKPKIIAVTGNVGKTSTKDAIYTAMSDSFFVRKSEKSFNSDIGIPLTILGCQNGWNNPFIWIKNIFHGLAFIVFREKYPEWLVLEVGADRPGDIRDISKWLKPNIAVVTKFAKVPVHIEFFNTREDLINEKWFLVRALKNGGTLVINADDEDSVKMSKDFCSRIVKYSIDNPADIRAENLDYSYEEIDGKKEVTGIIFRINYGGDSLPMFIKGSVGIPNVYSVLASVAVGFINKINPIKINEMLLTHDTPKGRMSLVRGIKNSVIIDDTYNSSPLALNSALQTLKDIKIIGRKIAVLGDMMELGKLSSEEHYNAGIFAGEFCDLILTVGMRSRKIAEGALDAGLDDSKIFQYDNSVDAGKEFQNKIKEGDLILIKGS